MEHRSSGPSESRAKESRALFDFLAHLDELESLRDQLDELGIATRTELEERIATLEAEAVKLESEA